MTKSGLLKTSALVSVFAVAGYSSAANAAIDELVVTAQKRAESIQDVGIAITAFTGDMLQERGIDSVIQLEDITPNLRIQQNFGAGVPNYAIRGVGSLTDLSTTSSSPVAIHINEVAHPYPVTSSGLLFDLERVEVLRGPQGDLFGLNTTGGTVNFITAKPTDEFSASIMGEVGNYESYKVEGYVSGPVSDAMRVRLAATHTERGEGWQTNFETGEKLGEMERTGLRGTIDLDLSDTINVLAEAHWSKNDSDAIGNRPITPGTGYLGFIDILYTGVADPANVILPPI